MAKTTNHPPYEIDPWKADTTEPPSGLTFNPEIVETAGKPKQAPVPPEPTEGQLKIEESISRVDKFNNEMNALREQQEKVLAEVEKNIDETDKKIKQLNELEEQIKQKVEEYTDETDGYLRQSELLKGELQESKAKMEKAVNDASSAITAAENAQKALKAYQDGEAERFKEAINQAQVGVAKAADVNKQITALKDSLGGEIDKQISTNETIKKIQSDNKGLSSKLDDALKTSKQGVDDAAKAIEILENRVEIGTSILPFHPGADYPEWTTAGVEKVKDTLPDGTEGDVWKGHGLKKEQDVSKLIPVKIDPRLQYRVSFWVKSDYTGDERQSFYFWVRNGMGSLQPLTESVDYKGTLSSWWRDHIISVTYVPEPNKWFYCERIFTFKPESEFATIFKINWGYHGNGSVYLHDLRAEPIIPSQADVDKAQNKAIEANSKAIEANSKAAKAQDDINKQNAEFQSLQKEFNTSQTKLNKTYDAMWDAQGKRNLLQEGIDSAQTKAIKSLSKIDIGGSLIPYAEPSDEEVASGNAVYDLPAYMTDTTSRKNVLSPPSGEGIKYTIGSPNNSEPVTLWPKQRPWVKVANDVTYLVTFWVYSTVAGSRLFVELKDQDGSNPTTDWELVEGLKSWWGHLVVSAIDIPANKWVKCVRRVKFNPSVDQIRVEKIIWNYSGPTGWQHICGLDIVPDVPSQAQIDKAQNEAIKANTLALENQKAINDKQDGIAAAHTKAIDSNRKAIRALAKIDLGGSLLAYMPLTDSEIQKGITREYTPAWAVNAANVLDGSKLTGTDSARGYVFLGASGGKASGGKVYAQVSPGTQYLLEIDVFSPVNTTIYLRMRCSNGKIGNTIKKLMWLEKDKYGGLKVTRTNLNLHSAVISSSDTYENGYRYLLEFKEGVEDIYIEEVSWTNSTSITVKSFSLAPYTPSQEAIDARQNKALEGLKLAQDLQRNMTKQQQDFTTKLYDMSAGVIHLLRDEVAGSITHEIGFVMPSTDRLFKIYARTSFRGNLTILVNYATGVGDGLKTHRVKDTNLVTMSNPRNISSSIIKRSIFEDMPYSYRFGEVKVDIGDVESIVVLIDHIDWKQG